MKKLYLQKLVSLGIMIICLFWVADGLTQDKKIALRDALGMVYTCDETDPIGVPDNYKNPCSNRKIMRRGSSILSVLKECPTDKPHQDVLGGCYHCDDKKTVTVKRGDNACPNRVVYTSNSLNEVNTYVKCPDETPLMDISGNCYSCDVSLPVSIHWNETGESCPNRKIVRLSDSDGMHSVLPGCDVFTHTDCYSCDDPRDIVLPVGRKLHYDKNGQIRSEILFNNPCSNRWIEPVGSEYIKLVRKVSCPNDKPLYAKISGASQPYECYPCEVSVALFRKNSDKVCANREYYENGWSCPSDKPILSDDNECHALDEEMVFIRREDAKHFPNRVVQDTLYRMVSYAPCPADKPIREYSDSAYSIARCVSPAEASEMVLKAVQKEICPQGYAVNGLCSVCPEGTFPARGSSTEAGHTAFSFYLFGTMGKSSENEYVCLPCDFDAEVYGGEKEVIALCPNRVVRTCGFHGNYSMPDTFKWRMKYVKEALLLGGFFCEVSR